MSEDAEDDDLRPLSVALEDYAVETEGDWLSDGREEYRRLLENEPEYHEVVREEFPSLYWGWSFTPNPSAEVKQELGWE